MSDKNEHKKMGRPIVGNEPKSEQYRIRLSKAESEKLTYCSLKTGMTKADVLRKGLEKVYIEIKEEK